jgi:hypothetical protein
VTECQTGVELRQNCIFTGQCLKRRIDDIEVVSKEVLALTDIPCIKLKVEPAYMATQIKPLANSYLFLYVA